jgi:5-(carboxyamino)imidazole ribonucleotide synthase
MKVETKILGILGGGQLGRMSALAAARLGIKTHIFCPEDNCPASQVTDRFTCAEYEDLKALEAFAASVDVISYEFENIPLETVQFLKKFKPVYPDEKLLAVSQNRLNEKKFLNDIGIPTAPWAAAYTAEDIDTYMKRSGMSECIIKTTRFGYDGKGQLKHNVKDDASEIFEKLGSKELIVEGIIDFAYEMSIIAARDVFGTIESFPPVVNEHKNHILSKTVSPAYIPDNIKTQAIEMAHRLAHEVGLIGVLALELFVSKDGRIIANEIAPRTHNSGHWTMDGCTVSQFEQHVRAVCGLPVAKPIQYVRIEMINLIGDDIAHLPEYYATAGACVHLYGKDEARPGRKMGHVNLIKTNKQD